MDWYREAEVRNVVVVEVDVRRGGDSIEQDGRESEKDCTKVGLEGALGQKHASWENGCFLVL